jgi:type I restriction enzyme S subunit
MNRAVEISVGSLSPTINWSALKLEKFALPPLDQQRRIAAILWAADEALCSLNELEITLNQNLVAVRDCYFSSRLKGKTKRVDQLFEVQLGKMLSPKARKGASPLPYLGNKNVQWGRFDLTEVLEMDFSSDEFEKFHLKVGDLLVCEGGEVGRSAIWDGSIPDCCFQKALHRLRPLNGSANPEYMLELMFWGGSNGMFSSLTGHSTIAHLTAIKLKGLAVPIVAAEEQQEFLAKTDGYRVALRSVANRKKDTEKVRSELLKAMIEGSV